MTDSDELQTRLYQEDERSATKGPVLGVAEDAIEYARQLEEAIQGLDHLVLEHDCPTCTAEAYQHCEGGIGAQGLHLDRVKKALTKTPTRRERTLDCMATDRTKRDEDNYENHACGLDPDHDGPHECGVPGCDHTWEGPEVPEGDG